MRLKYYYWILVGVWHLLLLVAAYFLFQEEYYWLFMLLQPVAFLSLVMAYRLYRHFQRPLELVDSGRGALQDRDFSVKFRATGVPEVDVLVDTYNNMIDTLRKERTLLQEQHYFLRKLIDASPSGILIMDHDGDISEANPRACELLGFDPTKKLAEDQGRHIVLATARSLAAGERRQITLGSAHHFRLEASAFVDRGFHRKFVQIEALTEEILAAEKRAYGKVIRMMAHEVNNSIGAVNALLDTLHLETDEVDENWVEDVRESLPIAIKRNQRLNTFMRNFADVVRLPAPHFERVDLSALLKQAVSLFQAQAQQQSTRLTFNTTGKSTTGPLFITADLYQLEQVLVNVIKNALESVGEGGEVAVELQARSRKIIIADNGPGLDAEAAEQIFTPFFTSKPNGQGIGLTIVREVLMNHDYQFSLRSYEDGWTRFVIDFQ